MTASTSSWISISSHATVATSLVATVDALLERRVEEDRKLKEEESQEQRRQCQERRSEWAGD